MHFSTSFGLRLKKGVFWKLKPLSAGGYTLHTLVLENKPATKDKWSILSWVLHAGVMVCVSNAFPNCFS